MVTLTPGSGRQVIMEAITGSGYAGDIALDDFNVVDGTCPPPGIYSLFGIRDCPSSSPTVQAIAIDMYLHSTRSAKNI